MAAQWRNAVPATETANAECDPIPDVELTPLIDAAARSLDHDLAAAGIAAPGDVAGVVRDFWAQS